MIDKIAGSEAASAISILWPCKACNAHHRLVLTKLDGRFAYTCRSRRFLGKVPPKTWSELKAAEVLFIALTEGPQ